MCLEPRKQSNPNEAALITVEVTGRAVRQTVLAPEQETRLCMCACTCGGGTVPMSSTRQRVLSLSFPTEQKYKDVEPSLKIKEVDGLELVRKFSEDMENMLRRKVEAVKVCQALPTPSLAPWRVWCLKGPFKNSTGFG